MKEKINNSTLTLRNIQFICTTYMYILIQKDKRFFFLDLYISKNNTFTYFVTKIKIIKFKLTLLSEVVFSKGLCGLSPRKAGLWGLRLLNAVL